MPLNIEPNLPAPDEFYEALNARLILLLANQVGDLALLREAIDRARRGIDEAPAGANTFPSQTKGHP